DQRVLDNALVERLPYSGRAKRESLLRFERDLLKCHYAGGSGAARRPTETYGHTQFHRAIGNVEFAPLCACYANAAAQRSPAYYSHFQVRTSAGSEVGGSSTTDTVEIPFSSKRRDRLLLQSS